MPVIAAGVVDLYPYRQTPSGFEYLLLRRAPDRLYAGSWRMVGGKIASGEQAWQTAVRELWEETGLHPLELVVIPSLNRFYEWQSDTVRLIPAFAASVDGDPVLNAEHDAHAWLGPDAAAARLAWPEQRRLLVLLDEMLTQAWIPDALRIPVQ